MHHIGFKTGLRVLLITLVATVGACGMKGDLYLPEQQSQTQSQSQPQPQKPAQKKKDSQDKEATDAAPDAATMQ